VIEHTNIAIATDVLLFLVFKYKTKELKISTVRSVV